MCKPCWQYYLSIEERLMPLSARDDEWKTARLPLLGMAPHYGGQHRSDVLQSLQGSARLVLPGLSTSSWYDTSSASVLAGTVSVLCPVRTPGFPSMTAPGLTHLHHDRLSVWDNGAHKRRSHNIREPVVWSSAPLTSQRLPPAGTSHVCLSLPP